MKISLLTVCRLSLFFGGVVFFVGCTEPTNEITQHSGPQLSQIVNTLQNNRQDAAYRNELQSTVDDFYASQTVDFGIVVFDLNRSIEAKHYASTEFVAASLYKLFVAYEVLMQIDEGSLSLNQETGTWAGSVSVDDCLWLMIAESNNECGRGLRMLIGADENTITRLFDLGFSDTDLRGDYPTTTAYDVAHLYTRLHNQNDLSAESTAILMDALNDQTFADRIPKGLPDGASIAHKTGELIGYSHDAGIISFNERDLIFVFLSGPWEAYEEDAPPEFISLTQQLMSQIE
jgi:beta-lactamase class A